MKGAAPEEQADKLRWQRVGNKIQVNNPTQHVMNFNEISLAGKECLMSVMYYPAVRRRLIYPPA